MNNDNKKRAIIKQIIAAIKKQNKGFIATTVSSAKNQLTHRFDALTDHLLTKKHDELESILGCVGHQNAKLRNIKNKNKLNIKLQNIMEKCRVRNKSYYETPLVPALFYNTGRRHTF
jgi:hypothetical protein